MTKHLLSMLLLAGSTTAFAQPTPFTTCPDINIAIIRDGNNAAETNPIYLHKVNTVTGVSTGFTGPVLNPADGSNLQINAVGLHPNQGLLYGMQPASSGNPLNALTPRPLFRVGENGQALAVGLVGLPPLQAGETVAVVNTAAGEVDVPGNYYFTAASGSLNIFTVSGNISTLWLGKIAGTAALPAGTAALSPNYIKIVSGDANSATFYNSLLGTINSGNIQTKLNAGLRDFVFNAIDGNLYTYVTFPANPALPNGAFNGQLLKLNPNTGVLTAVVAPAVLPAASASRP
ncbi:MAG: hypothetical protein EOP51_30825, partial [Sphingobacteriales bacterium]